MPFVHCCASEDKMTRTSGLRTAVPRFVYVEEIHKKRRLSGCEPDEPHKAKAALPVAQIFCAAGC